MKPTVKLVSIPKEEYKEYRYNAIFHAYKWDPQVEDHNTLSRQVLLLDQETVQNLSSWAEQLANETVMMEEAFLRDLPIVKQLGYPGKINRIVKRMDNYNPSQHVRLMRFDFHPVNDGWAVSEVNSDVPGGFAEASVLPQLAAAYFEGYEPGANAAECLYNGFASRVKKGGRIAFVHCTSYSDDRQVMQCLGDYFSEHGFDIFFAAPDHIRWKDKKAISILEGKQGPVDGIVRFFPLEWLVNLPRKSEWKGYYDTVTTSCNHPIALYAQSKRLPLVWDKLGVSIPAWKKFLPETLETKGVKPDSPAWIYKPALGRVGEGISVKGAVSEKEYKKIQKAARKQSKHWIAQRMFESKPLVSDDGKEYHLCIGVFVIEGKFAGFYGRISPFARIDERARDIPVLIAKL